MKRVGAVKLGLLLVAAIVGTTVTSACADDNSWSQEEKAEAIAIALEDSDVRQQLGDNEYEIGDVVLNRVEGTYKGKSFSGEFPTVPLVMGNPELPGVTILVFVDPTEESVVGIGRQYRR